MTIKEAQSIIKLCAGVSAELLLIMHNGKGKPTKTALQFLLERANKKANQYPKYFVKCYQ